MAGFAALKVRAYQWYALVAILQQCAESMKQLANGWYAYELTGSTAILGLTLLAQAIPQTLFSFVGGVFSDRFPRVKVWLATEAVALVLPIWMAVHIFTGTMVWQILVAQSFIFGIVLAVRAPARQGVMTEVVSRDLIQSAVSINTTLMNILMFAGPAVAGFIIALLGIEWVYVSMAGFYILAILALTQVKYERRNTSLRGNKGSIFSNFTEGVKYVLGRAPDVRAVLGLTLLAGAFAMPYNQLLPAFGKDVLGTTPDKLGILSSLTGIGALGGSLFITMIRPKVRGVWVIRVVAFTGICIFLFSLSNSFLMAATVIVFIGVNQAIRQTLQSTLIQTYTETAYLGRVISINMAQMGLSSLASFAVALGAEAIGVRWAVMTTAIVLTTIGAAYFLFSRRLRNLV
jgi:MFS family permease